MIIFLAELGDRTFIMVMLFSTYVNRLYLLIFACVAMVAMHTLSTLIGAFFAYLIPKNIIQILVIILFTSFGLLMLYKGCFPKSKDDDESDEEEEIKNEFEKFK